MTYTLHHGDCLDILPTLPSGSIDAVIADPPYGKTALKWDSVLPFDVLWLELKRIIKPNGPIVLFGVQPFSSLLITSNLAWFKYEWIWHKPHAANFIASKYRPLAKHENVMVFCEGTSPYYPQMVKGEPVAKRTGKFLREGARDSISGKRPHILSEVISDEYYPSSVQFFSTGAMCQRLHPTQKPVELLRYLVRTYTNPRETVLDFTMGSGTTGVACAMEGRHFIGVELDAGYFDIAKRRIEQVQPALMEAAD